MSRPQAPTVSVLMPSYNHAAFVEDAARSALRAADHAGVSMQLIVVDDGSTDDSVARLEALGDSRLHLEVQHNAGAHRAFNRLLELAGGDLIFLLNSDDLFEPERISRTLACFREDPGIVAAGSFVRVIDVGGTELGIKQGWRTMPPWPRGGRGPFLADLGDPRLALLETNFLATSSNIAFRRSALGSGLRFRGLRYCHDWDFFLGLCHHGRLALLEEPLVGYRVHPRNTLKETESAGTGQAAMRFEILWLLARHAARLCRQVEADLGAEPGRRLWASLPRFGADALLLQLLAWRGDGERAPPSYDALLDPNHPFRRQAEKALEGSS